MSIIVKPNSALTQEEFSMTETNLKGEARKSKNVTRMSVLTSSASALEESEGRSTDRSGAFTADALLNYLVLKNVFKNLDSRDINSCCEVNKYWNTLADPLLVTYYDVDVVGGISINLGTPFHITKWATYKSEQVECGYFSIGDASKFLEAAVRTDTIAVHLHFVSYGESEILNSFLSRFGSFVEKFWVKSAGYPFATKQYCEMLARYFPNLKHLVLYETTLLTEEQLFDEHNLTNRLKFLRRIDVRRDVGQVDHVALVTLFRMAPNLEEIHDFPIARIDALVKSEKGGCLKSLKYAGNTICDIYQRGFEKLAGLGVKLHSFSFAYSYMHSGKTLCSREAERFIRRILQSSYDSLESLTLYNSDLCDFYDIPLMNSLKEVGFWLENYKEGCSIKFVGQGVQLQKLFPSVSTVTISTEFNLHPIPDIMDLFPGNQFSSWGLKIQELKLKDVSGNFLEQLSKLFPSVKKLQFRLGANIGDLQLILPTLGQCWPELQHLTIIFSNRMYSCINRVQEIHKVQQSTLDSILTGIPNDIVAKLSNPSYREKYFSSEEIDNLKEASTIRQFSRLKVLTFDLDGLDNHRFINKKLAALTSVSKEFGFQFLPELKVVVQTRRDDIFCRVSEIKTTLEALVNFEVKRLR